MRRRRGARPEALPSRGKPVVLDLFCGAGGSAMGYYQAGFDIVGVDNEPQPNYPFDFICMDAFDYLGAAYWGGIAAIHASPPCQRYSKMTHCRPGLAGDYPDFISPVREALIASGKPWIIENVPGSPLKNPVTLCGQMFGLELYRHRLFETSFDVPQPEHPPHLMPSSRAGHWTPGTIMSVSGHIAPVSHAREIMGIDWTTREELAEAIPPAYTRYIASYLEV